MKRTGFERGAVAVPGGSLDYLIEGSGHTVLVPGSVVYYPRTFSDHLRSHCRLIHADLRHFSANSVAGGATLTLDTYIADIEEIRAALALERFVLLGHSHHGNLALEYARQYPQRVSHLVMVGSPPCTAEFALHAGEEYWQAHASRERKRVMQRNRIARRQASVADYSPGAAFIADYLADAPRYWFDMRRDAAFLWQGVPIDSQALRAFRTFFSGDYAFGWDPARMPMPVLVVMGKHDYVVPHHLWDAVVRMRPQVRYHLFGRSGHTPQLEQPAIFDRVLLEFLGSTRRGN
ncbi:MAG: alpha/beta hydrolase [Ectothiorhodospiraceae bacterium]|nr:alpha/beta hydrolase [Ectothiorhodospiraceae bacterium]MCH8505005.1 alpha/beta hydrolase [Ectothiorhodospiraceae bacterium]